MAPRIGEIATVVRGKYACPVCPKRFTELALKKQHIREQHPRKDEA